MLRVSLAAGVAVLGAHQYNGKDSECTGYICVNGEMRCYLDDVNVRSECAGVDAIHDNQTND